MLERLKKYLSSPLGSYYLAKRVIKIYLRRIFPVRGECAPLARHHEAPILGDEIVRYWAARSNRKSIGVVYTCITGGYDDVEEIGRYGFVDPNWDYVCFTDKDSDITRKRIGIWEIRPLQYSALDGTRNNRWHKMHPHVLFPEYTQSIYVDSNIDILSPWLFEEMRKRDSPLLLPRHPTNRCIFQEYENVLSGFKDTPGRILSERALIRRDGMPRDYGFTENNILCRRHNDLSIRILMEDWWRMVCRYSKRDQLSFVWLLWKRGIRVADVTFENARYQPENFCVFLHKFDPARKCAQ